MNAIGLVQGVTLTLLRTNYVHTSMNVREMKFILYLNFHIVQEYLVINKRRRKVPNEMFGHHFKHDVSWVESYVGQLTILFICDVHVDYCRSSMYELRWSK